MREIEFRGRQVKNNFWVHGNLVIENNRTFIVGMKVGSSLGFSAEYWLIEVKPETVGQYIGLKDKYGSKIYEGDVVRANWYMNVKTFSAINPTSSILGRVEFCANWQAYRIVNYSKKQFAEINGNGFVSWDIEIMGTISDKSALWEGKI